jgi:hypothetical protein
MRNSIVQEDWCRIAAQPSAAPGFMPGEALFFDSLRSVFVVSSPLSVVRCPLLTDGDRARPVGKCRLFVASEHILSFCGNGQR